MPTNEEMTQALLGSGPGAAYGGGLGLLSNKTVSDWLERRHQQDFGTPSKAGAFQDVLSAANLLPMGKGPILRSSLPFAKTAAEREGLISALAKLKEANKNALTDKEINSYLAKNPGGSIFDLAGVDVPGSAEHMAAIQSGAKQIPPEHWGPSSIYNDPTGAFQFWKKPPAVSTLPRDAQWYLPKRAIDAGYNVAAHHGTVTPELFSKFKLPYDELGVHFGSPQAAQDILRRGLSEDYAHRVYPVSIKAQNPITMSDLGSWGPRDLNEWFSSHRDMFRTGAVKDAMDESRALMDAHYARWRNNQPEQGPSRVQPYRNLLTSHGYDSVKYKNAVEDPGSTSYILFNESPTEPGHVMGARSPWAAYDPNKRISAELLAGLAGGGVALPSLFEDQR